MPISKVQQKKLTVLGQRVRQIREKQNLSLEDLGAKIDKERQSISRLENGRVNPSYLYLLDICKGLGIRITDLFSDISE